MSILTISGLTHIFDEKTLFDDASVVINNGEHCGIVGLNGAGKSTFMNIIAGRIIQDAGEVKWVNGIKWGYLDQHANIDRKQTVMEYLEGSFKNLFDMNIKMEEMYMEMATETDPIKLDKLVEKTSKIMEQLNTANFYDLEANIKKVANGLGVNAFGYDTIVGTLSGGQRAKLMLAKLLLEELDIMLLDEPTNFLDIEHIAWLVKYLEAFKGTFLLISHDTEFLNSVCKIIINIENRQIKKYTGNYNEFMGQRDSNAKQYAESYERQQREIKKMQDYIAKNKARASTAGMANSRKKMLDKIEVIEKPHSVDIATFSFPYVFINTKDMLTVENLRIGYDKQLLPPINIHMKSGEKLWIRGTNGIGKSTLLKTLMKRIPSLGGDFEFNINAKVGYLEQDLNFKDMDGNAIAYINEIYPKMGQKEIRNELAKVGLKNDLAMKPIFALSGGEQVRAKLCGMTKKETNILILDEPTNHLDVNAKNSLRETLIAYEGAVILVSHEIPFAKGICDDVFDIEEN